MGARSGWAGWLKPYRMIYTKGKLVQEAGIETYCFLISSKKAI